jgi:hypothetical protein
VSQAWAGHLPFSHDNEGFLAKEELLRLFGEFCTDFSFAHIRFRRFRAEVDRENRVYRTDHTHEFLVLAGPRPILVIACLCSSDFPILSY